MPGDWRLRGRKVYCSGAGSIRRAVITAVPVDSDAAGADSRGGAPLMLLLDLAGPGITIDLTPWHATGMRGTVSGTVDFDGIFVPHAAVIGEPGDYYCAPWFCGGAWRVLAVQLGGLDRLMTLHADVLRASGRGGEPVVRARFADAAAAHETARLLVREAALRVE